MIFLKPDTKLKVAATYLEIVPLSSSVIAAHGASISQFSPNPFRGNGISPHPVIIAQTTRKLLKRLCSRDYRRLRDSGPTGGEPS
jgi:hypothetical protein